MGRGGGAVLSVLLVFYGCAAASGQGADILKQGQTLREGQTLVSRRQVFELGFFTLPGGGGGASGRSYVGIWYYDVPEKTVVWVANRNEPLTGGSSVLTIDRNGSLVILDGSGGRRWSTNTSAPGGAGSVLQLADDGNLFLNTSDGGTVLWQSFEHPTDTFLPGMKITLDRGVHRNPQFTAWRAAGDPSEGNYSLGLERTGPGSAQIFIWRGSAPYWRTGQWVGGRFSGVKVRPLSIYGWNLLSADDQGRTVVTYTPFNNSLLRFRLQPDGKENISILVNDTRRWRSAFLQPTGRCDTYNICGDNAKCLDSGAGGEEAACECLRGFRPRSPADWAGGDWAGGCVRRSPLRCELNGTMAASAKNDGFWRLSAVNLPDLSEWKSAAATAGDCMGRCLDNCFCVAYSYVDGGGCMTWSGSLVDVHQFSDGFDIFVKLAGDELATQSKAWIVILIIVLLIAIVLLLSGYLWWAHGAKIKEWCRKSRKGEMLLYSLRRRREAPPDFTAEFVDQSKDEKGSELPLFSFDCVATATGFFSESSKLGQGGFGHVYKGILPGGREIAVKRLSEKSGQGLEEFKNEVILIAKLQHRNLVRLMGCCIQGDEKILIYEYLPNKSLDAFIFDPAMSSRLDWKTRFSIIEGIARGLLYLHRDSRLRIIHRDLKASNILLDAEMNPKISDFGMARIFGGNQNQANTTRVVGTFGYMSPEYAMEGLFSIKSDVYSFGVLTLEIICGRRNNSFHRAENAPNLVGRAWRLWNEDKALDLVDPAIRGTVSTREVMRCVQVGLLCVQDRASERPTMASVVFMLENEASPQPAPKQPNFTLEGSPAETTEAAGLGYESHASADVTVTVITGR